MNNSFTSGKIITENEFRTYAKCSELYNFGSKINFSIGLKIVKDTIEQLTLRSIRGSLRAPLLDIQACLLKSVTKYSQEESLIEPQIERYLNACMLWLQDFFNLFNFSTYIPVFGPIAPIIRISKTPIRLDISGLYRSKKNQTIHGISFSPYSSRHSISNDPTTLLKVKLLSPFVAEHFPTRRAKVVLHNFFYGKNNNIGYVTTSSNQIKDSSYLMIENIVQNMEKGHHYPIVPCLYSCKFKKSCFPTGLKNE